MGGQCNCDDEPAFRHVAGAKRRLRALAVGSEKRSVFLPNVPTIAESGYPDIAPITGGASQHRQKHRLKSSSPRAELSKALQSRTSNNASPRRAPNPHR
jgi:tripartite-type tricarboxylate transporter receptor subunit TctC